MRVKSREKDANVSDLPSSGSDELSHTCLSTLNTNSFGSIDMRKRFLAAEIPFSYHIASHVRLHVSSCESQIFLALTS
jgi:hypothetical protein